MPDSKSVTIDAPTRKAIAVAVAALCVCVAGALLVVGRSSGGTSFAAAAPGAQGVLQPRRNGGPSPGGGSFQGHDGQDGTGESGSMEAFRRCLENHGFTLPEPSDRWRRQRPAPTDELRQAFSACRQYLPQWPSGGPGSGIPGDGSDPAGPPPDGSGNRGSRSSTL